MEAKIDFENLANEDNEKIMSRYKELHADKGTVYAWQLDTENPPSARTFSSEENAKEFEARRDAWKAKNPAPSGFKKVQNYILMR